ncbi:MAG: type II toxin-antitoxin system RelE/ParE family toxin [Pseudomonadota bacterium]
MPYKLSRKAEDDLIHIYIEGVRLFGVPQADAYYDKLQHSLSIVANHPRIARERTELKPPMRIHPCGAHIIVYREQDDSDVLIVRIRHHAEDWISDPAGGGETS